MEKTRNVGAVHTHTHTHTHGNLIKTFKVNFTIINNEKVR